MRHSGLFITDSTTNQPINPAENSFIQQKDSSFVDYMQTSAHNLSFTNIHHMSFEIEDHIPAQHSPIQQSSAFLPQSFLSKPFEENNYDMTGSALVGSQTPSSRFNWQNQFGLNNNQANNVIGSNNYNNDHLSSIHYGTHQLWESHDPVSLIEQEIPQNQMLSQNYAQDTFTETINGYLNDRNNNQRPTNNVMKQMNSSKVCTNFMEMMDEEEEEGESKSPANKNNVKSESDKVDNQLLFQKNPIGDIVVDYENYQEKIKVGLKTFATPEKTQFANLDNYFNELNCDFDFPIDYSPGQKNPFQTDILDTLENDQMFNPHFINTPNKQSEGQSMDKQEIVFETGQEGCLENTNKTNIDNLVEASEQESVQASGTSQACVCNCKKTKCLKLYCECFAKLGYCGEGCHCHECKNKPEFEDERALAITEAKQRKHDAFAPKTLTETEQQAEIKRKQASENSKKGCNCRKTKCLKKYCECFNAGQFCNILCKCENCENQEGNPYFTQQKRGDASSVLITHHPSTNQLYFPTYESYNSSFLRQNALDYQMPQGLYLPQQQLGLTGMSKFPLTLQSFRYQMEQQNAHTHSSLLGFAKQDGSSMSELNIDEAKPSNYLKQKASYQRKLMFDGENEESEQLSSSNNSIANSIQRIGKVKQMKSKGLLAASKKNSKKPIIKRHNDNSDEDYSNSTSQASSYDMRQRQTMRIKNRSEAAMTQDEDALLKQQLDDMEKKLKQIQQVSNIIEYQQQLQQEQAQIINSTFVASDSVLSCSDVDTTNFINFEEKTQELRRQKQELEQSLRIQSQLIQEIDTQQQNSQQKIEEELQPVEEKVREEVQDQRLSSSSERKNTNNKAKALRQQLSGEKSDITASSPISSYPEGEVLNCPEAMEDESVPSACQQEGQELSNSPTTARSSRRSKFPQSSTRLKAVSSSQLFSLQQIAPTAKPSEILFDPSNFTLIDHHIHSERCPHHSHLCNSSVRSKRTQNNTLIQAP